MEIKLNSVRAGLKLDLNFAKVVICNEIPKIVLTKFVDCSGAGAYKICHLQFVHTKAISAFTKFYDVLLVFC